MTELCIANLSAVLKAAGSDISKVVKVNVFLTTMDNFAEMNATVRILPIPCPFIPIVFPPLSIAISKRS
jgi:predicted histidine transporter YuiF (NhaC family)